MTPKEMRLVGIPDVDGMGYSNVEAFEVVTLAELEGARALARDQGYAWDIVGTDPRVGGKRFLRAARIVLEAAYALEPIKGMRE